MCGSVFCTRRHYAARCVCRLRCKSAATNGVYSSGSANYEADEFTAAGVVDGVDDTASVDFVNGGYAVFKVSANAGAVGANVVTNGSECCAARCDDFIAAAESIGEASCSSSSSSHNIILYVCVSVSALMASSVRQNQSQTPINYPSPSCFRRCVFSTPWRSSATYRSGP